MRIVIAGGHGRIARRLARLLADRGDSAVGLIRDPGQADDLRADGAEPVVCDLEGSDVATVAGHLAGADAVVFAAGAGPGSGAARKDTVDRAAAALLADAAERAGVRRYLMVSAIGAGNPPTGAPQDVFGAYLQAKAAADTDLTGRDLDWTVLRPGGLLDDPGVGRVRLESSVGGGAIPRDDVAAVLLALLDTPASTGRVWEVVSGETPIPDAVAALLG
jgi:uncharacterized protein YbjT (DUF2867 family)